MGREMRRFTFNVGVGDGEGEREREEPGKLREGADRRGEGDGDVVEVELGGVDECGDSEDGRAEGGMGRRKQRQICRRRCSERSRYISKLWRNSFCSGVTGQCDGETRPWRSEIRRVGFNR